MDKQSIDFINRLTREADEIGLDAQGWGPSEANAPGWREALGPITPKYDAMISYGFGDQVLAIFEGIHSRGYTWYIVGIGEALRPYIELYTGDNVDAAVRAFAKQARKMINTVKEGILEEGSEV